MTWPVYVLTRTLIMRRTESLKRATKSTIGLSVARFFHCCFDGSKHHESERRGVTFIILPSSIPDSWEIEIHVHRSHV